MMKTARKSGLDGRAVAVLKGNVTILPYATPLKAKKYKSPGGTPAQRPHEIQILIELVGGEAGWRPTKIKS